MNDLFIYDVDRNVAIDPLVCYYAMESCPMNVKVQLHTIGGIAAYGMIRTEADRAACQGWRPLPKGRKET